MKLNVFGARGPSEKQKEFLRAKTRFIAYGGARGGGKSWAVRKKAVLLAIRYPGIKILLLRRTFPELRENHILPLMADLMGIAIYKELDKAFTFPNGSRIKFGYCAAESDVLQYQGQEYDIIFLDEATQFTEFQFVTLTPCLRGANKFPKRFYLTCNPGGVGHAWVKRLFIDRDYKNSEKPEDYSFIKARVYDNPALMENDPGYVQMLENLPTEEMRRAWLDGDWDVFSGQYFTEFRRDKHVCRPFVLPSYWRRYFVMDYGLDMFAGYWIAMDEEGRAYVYREYCEANLIISRMVEKIRELTTEKIYEYIAPPDMWSRRQETGKSPAEIASEYGIDFVPAANDRVAGWLNLHEWLRTEGEQKPKLQIFENCKELIKYLPLLQFDPKNPNDVAREPHEITHSPDALRYFVAGRPLPGDTPRGKKRYNFEFEKPKTSPLGRGGKEQVI